MATGYQINGVDLDDLCEQLASDSYSTESGLKASQYQYGDGSTLAYRYNKPNTDVWARPITLPFLVNGETLTTIEKGCLPTQTKFAEITSSGTYDVTVSSDGLTIGSTTYPPSHFRGGVIPKYIGIMICGGGGGAGGWGCDTGDKYGYTITPGGGGAGGGIALCVAKTENIDYILIGAGGTSGSNGSSDSRPSNGTSGTTGGASGIQIAYDDGTLYAFACYGGTGGDYGRGSANDHAVSVAGGTVVENMELLPEYGGLSYTSSGGVGGTSGRSVGGGKTSLTSFKFSSCVSVTDMFYNSSTGYEYTDSDSYRDSWGGGGCSIGRGATKTSSAYKGGGGASGNHSYKAGANGYCAFYY